MHLRYFICLLAAPLWSLTASFAGPAAEPTPAAIAAAIKNLGAADFTTREEASQFLWSAGNTAAEALKTAAQHADPEIALRARELIENIEFGIRPDTPAEVRELLRRYQTAPLLGKQAIVRELFAKSEAGRRQVQLLAEREPDLETRVRIFQPLLQFAQWDELTREAELTDEVVARAVAELEFWIGIFPEDITLPLNGVRHLDQLGQKKFADRLFARALDWQLKLVARAPDKADFHNNLAWLCAVSRRELDRALTHAERAVKLAPNEAAYIDTLAEVQFQRGNTARALELINQAVKLEPETDYFRDQLARFEKGDRAVPPNEPY